LAVEISQLHKFDGQQNRNSCDSKEKLKLIMLRQKKLFKLLNLMLSCFNPRELSKNRTKLALFTSVWLLLAMKIVLFAIEIVLNSSGENIAKCLQVFPTMAIIMIGAVSFMINSLEIDKFCDEMDEVIEKSENKEMFENCYNRISPIVVTLALATFFTMVLNSAVFLLTGRNVIPFYLPESEGPIFVIFWMESTFCTCIWTSVLSTLDMQSIILLSLLETYSKTLRLKFEHMNIENANAIKSSIELHVRFQRFISFP
jgi:hypothetical protein